MSINDLWTVSVGKKQWQVKCWCAIYDIKSFSWLGFWEQQRFWEKRNDLSKAKDKWYIRQLPRLYDRFLKFYFQTIDHSHCIQRGFDISKCNYKCVGHLHFDQDETDFECHMETNFSFKRVRHATGYSSSTFIYYRILQRELFSCYNLFVCFCVFNPCVGYTIAIIGIDRYIRIKCFVNFKAIWTTWVVLTLSSIGCIFVLIQALVMTTGLLLRKEEVSKRIYIAIDSTIIALVILLQLQTIKTSKALHNESTISASERIDKKILKLSIRIMTFLCFLLCYLLLSSMFYVKYFKSS